MRRRLIGIIAVLLLAGAVWFYFFPPQSSSGQQFEAACWRLGAMLTAVWLAYHEINRMPAWIWAVIPAVAIILAKWPRWLMIGGKALLPLLPILIVLAVVLPRLRRKGQGSGKK